MDKRGERGMYQRTCKRGLQKRKKWKAPGWKNSKMKGLPQSSPRPGGGSCKSTSPAKRGLELCLQHQEKKKIQNKNYNKWRKWCNNYR
jgi:hypothetical protein